MHIQTETLNPKRGWFDTWISQIATILPNVFASLVWYVSLVYVVVKGLLQLTYCTLVITLKVLWIVVKAAASIIGNIFRSLRECKGGTFVADTSEEIDDSVEIEDPVEEIDNQDDDINDGMRFAAEKGAIAAGFTRRRLSRN